MTEPLIFETARVAAGHTQGQLAKMLGVSQPFISQIERGERSLPSELIDDWAKFCRVDRSLATTQRHVLDDAASGLLHRRLKTLPAKPFNQATAQVRLRALECETLFEEVEVVPAIPLPLARLDSSPEEAAEIVRRTWRVPRGPIDDLTRLVEAAGIPVLHLESLHEKQLGMSHRGQWYEWLVVLNSRMPASRQRYTLAHELGHIVLGHDQKLTSTDVAAANELESEADRFAAALLMPLGDAERELRSPTFKKLVLLKQRWQVSIAFLIRRALDAERITASRRRQLEIQLSSSPGGRKNEPAEFDAEQPRLLKRLVQSLQEDELSVDDIASLTHAAADTLREVYLQEQPRLRAVPMPSKRKRLELHLVDSDSMQDGSQNGSQR